MSIEHYPRLERRTSVRISPKGSILVTTEAWTQRARIANIGNGGLLATTTGAPLGALDEEVELELRLDVAEQSWLKTTGRIGRLEADAIAIVFDAVPLALHELIVEASHVSRSHDRRISVVLIDGTPDRRIRISEAFRAAGCVVVEVETPLEAIVRLGESHFEPDLIAISDSLPSSISDELHGFVENAHPSAKLVRIGDDTPDLASVGHWLSSANPANDLVRRIRVLLGRPI